MEQSTMDDTRVLLNYGKAEAVLTDGGKKVIIIDESGKLIEIQWETASVLTEALKLFAALRILEGEHHR